MPASVRDGGTWKTIDQLSVRDAGTWKNVVTGYVRDAGVWKEFYSASTPLAATIAPSSYANTVSNNTGPYTIGFTCTPTGGSGSYTYTWSISGAGWSILSGQGTNSVQVQVANGTNTLYSGLLTCTVNDGSESVAPTASLSMTYGTPV